jgi:hypothetical protein
LLREVTVVLSAAFSSVANRQEGIVGKKKKQEVTSKKAAKKKAGKDKKAAKVAAAEPGKLDREERLEMIRTAAYHLAEQRGFHPGLEVDDWLLAEQDIEEMFVLDEDD